MCTRVKVSNKRDENHCYALRSCLNCNLWSTCIVGEKRRKNCTVDFARYGCKNYTGEHDSEEKLTPTQLRKYLNKK